MTGDGVRWRRLRAIFDEVVQLSPHHQPARLARMTEGDPELRAEIESLLAAERTAGDRFERAP